MGPVYRSTVFSSLVLAFVLLVCAQAGATPLASGLLGYWKFDGSGVDSSGNGRDVSLFGGAGFGPGLFGQALSLNGTQGMFAQRPSNDTVFDFGSGDFTIQLWANFNINSREQTLIEKFTGGGGPGWTLTTAGGGSVEQFYASPTIILNSPSMTFPTGVWQQFVVRRSGNTFSLFYDDMLEATGTTSSPLPTSSNPLLIGARNSGDGRNFTVDGRIDEVAIWNRGLSDSDIAALWNNGKGMEIPLVRVPEPSSLACFSVGLAGVCVVIRRKQSPRRPSSL